VIQDSIAMINADWEQALNYDFVERDVQVRQNGARSVKTFQVMILGGSPYRRLIALDDHAISPAEEAEEVGKLADEIKRRRRESPRERFRRIDKYQKERRQDRSILGVMAEAFTFRLSGRETLDGHHCWVLEAEPKRGYQPVDRQAKVLTGMKGRLWIDETQNRWVKVEAQVFAPVSFVGFLAKVGPGTYFLLEQERVEGDLWLPKHFSVRVNASALGFIDESSTSDETYRDYRAFGHGAQ
jgi:hypothetical protein